MIKMSAICLDLVQAHGTADINSGYLTGFFATFYERNGCEMREMRVVRRNVAMKLYMVISFHSLYCELDCTNPINSCATRLNASRVVSFLRYLVRLFFCALAPRNARQCGDFFIKKTIITLLRHFEGFEVMRLGMHTREPRTTASPHRTLYTSLPVPRRRLSYSAYIILAVLPQCVLTLELQGPYGSPKFAQTICSVFIMAPTLDDYDSDSYYACSILTSSSTSTKSDRPGPGRVVDKYVYQPTGRLIENALRRVALPSGSVPNSAPNHASKSTGYEPAKKPPRPSTIKEALLYATAPEALSECSLITYSTTSTRSNVAGPGRIIDKYVYQVVGRLIEKCLGRIALKVGPSPQAVVARIKILFPSYRRYRHSIRRELPNNHIAESTVVIFGCTRLVAQAQADSTQQCLEALQGIVDLSENYPSLLLYFGSGVVSRDIYSAFSKSDGRTDSSEELESWIAYAHLYLIGNTLSTAFLEAQRMIQSAFEAKDKPIQTMDIIRAIRYAISQVVFYSRFAEDRLAVANFALNLYWLTSFFGPMQNRSELGFARQYSMPTALTEVLFDIITFFLALRRDAFGVSSYSARGAATTQGNWTKQFHQSRMNDISGEMDMMLSTTILGFMESILLLPLRQQPERLRRIRSIFDIVVLFQKTENKNIMLHSELTASSFDWQLRASEIRPSMQEFVRPALHDSHHRHVVGTIWRECMLRADRVLKICSVDEFGQFLQKRWLGSNERFFESLLSHSRSCLDDEDSLGVLEVFGEAPYASIHSEVDVVPTDQQADEDFVTAQEQTTTDADRQMGSNANSGPVYHLDSNVNSGPDVSMNTDLHHSSEFDSDTIPQINGPKRTSVFKGSSKLKGYFNLFARKDSSRRNTVTLEIQSC
ncbi:hypothetical protein DFH11DRAFT_589433 [Phellopilus nigrolimitatus]|nr:hypothetical protein DFH11DRAFT_589433 [Phellopilus nigrolimitatus]